MNIIKIIISCLSITIAVELFIALLLKVKDKLDIVNIILVNILTNPLAVTIPFYINIRYGLSERNIALAILEVFAVVSEGFIYKKYLKFKRINPYLLSLILNIGSYAIGELINYIVY